MEKKGTATAIRSLNDPVFKFLERVTQQLGKRITSLEKADRQKKKCKHNWLKLRILGHIEEEIEAPSEEGYRSATGVKHEMYCTHCLKTTEFYEDWRKRKVFKND